MHSRGLSVFDLLRYRQHDRAAVLCAFDLIELDGRDLRKTPAFAAFREGEQYRKMCSLRKNHG